MIEKPLCHYFKLSMSSENPEDMGYESGDQKGFDPSKFMECEWIEEWPDDIVFYVHGTRAVDFSIIVAKWFVVSDRFRKALENSRVDGVQFLPVQVLHHETGEAMGVYWSLNALHKAEALDWDRTRWISSNKLAEKYPKDQYPLLYIMEMALQKDALEGIDVFRVSVKGQSHPAVLISERLKVALEEAGATDGLYFIKVPAY